MSGGTYARGSLAWGICQRCGLRALLNDLVFDGRFQWLRVHPECFEDKHPQERMIPLRDPIALYRPSPEDNDITTPVLVAQKVGNAILLEWTRATTQGPRIEGYIVYRSDNGDNPVQLIGEPVQYDWDASKIFEPLGHTDSLIDVGHTYGYYVSGYDCYQREISSNTVIQAA